MAELGQLTSSTDCPVLYLHNSSLVDIMETFHACWVIHVNTCSRVPQLGSHTYGTRSQQVGDVSQSDPFPFTQAYVTV